MLHTSKNFFSYKKLLSGSVMSNASHMHTLRQKELPLNIYGAKLQPGMSKLQKEKVPCEFCSAWYFFDFI